MDRVVEYFKSLPAWTTFDSISEAYYHGSDEAPEEREEKMEAMSEDAWGAGIEAIVKMWPADLLSVILKNLRVAFPPDRNPDNRNVMVKSIIYVLEAEGMEAFKDSSYTASFLETLVSSFVEANGKNNSKDVSSLEPLDALEALIVDTGLRLFFGQFTEKHLSLWCNEIGIELNTGSKKLLVSALVTKSKPSTVVREKPVVSSAKPKLPCSAVDAKAWYSRKELVDFLATRGLSTSGTVAELAKRVSECTSNSSKGIKRVADAETNLENEQPNKKLRGRE